METLDSIEAVSAVVDSIDNNNIRRHRSNFAQCINCIFLFDKIETLNGKLKKDEVKGNSIPYECFQLIMMIIDLGLVILFVVAAHLKNVKLLKISFIGNLTSVILYTIWCLYMIIHVSQLLSILSMISSDKARVNSLIWMIVKGAAISFTEILMKFYIMFLLRTEIRKLEANCVFSFVNNAIEPKCKMESDVEVEKGMVQLIKVNNDEEELEDIFDKI